MSGSIARTDTPARPLAAKHLAALAALVVLPACTPASNDPAMQPPTKPTETILSGEAPPPTVPAVAPPASPLAAHEATQFVLTELTQVERSSSRAATIDLRYDALDASGNSTRMAGELRIVLRAAGAEPEYLVFDVRIATEGEQLKHFDETLRVYVVRLEPVFTKPPAPGASIGVASTLRANDGGILESEGAFAW
ncbi:MAG: hypothetical protein LW806_09690 [Planctomycetaceae bacterium]|jgi:hypothetical protein|nr:hypothetical protein [Planctomycetaceae bacterium]